MPRGPNNWRILLLLLTIGSAGCSSPYIRTPNFAHPGTAAEQRADAERFDPYPDPDAGPPVLGGRPPGFTRPLTETEWARRYAAPPGLQPAPAFTLPGAPVITNPFAPPPAPPAFQPLSYPAVPPPTPSQLQPRNPY
jgi:hypothetical protein